jgi:hypothetical protein
MGKHLQRSLGAGCKTVGLALQLTIGKTMRIEAHHINLFGFLIRRSSMTSDATDNR